MEEMTEGQRLFRDVVNAAGDLADMATAEMGAPQAFIVLRDEVRSAVDKMLLANEAGDTLLVGAVTIMELVIKIAGIAVDRVEDLDAARLQRVIEIGVAVAVQRIDELTRV